MPKSKKEKPSVSPPDLAERIAPLVGLRSRALVRRLFGDVAGASEVLERLAELLRALDEEPEDRAAPDGTANGPASGSTKRQAPPRRRRVT